jgi:Trk-type K+ transport system membrane component
VAEQRCLGEAVTWTHMWMGRVEGAASMIVWRSTIQIEQQRWTIQIERRQNGRLPLEP